MKIQDLLLKFQGVKQVSENQYMAICPAHDDHSPSLSIGLSKDRKQILLNCFAGCKAEDILNNVGLKLKDMYDNDERNETNTMSKTVYTYYNADGSIAYTKNRFDKADGKKSFSFVRPNGEKGLGDKKPVPYNLPEVIRAQKVYFVEGEKCADAVIQAGRVATTLNCGSGSKWLSEYQDYFMGKEVVILPDNDKPGMKYAKKIVENIPNAKIVCLPGLPPKGDVYDWLKAGHSMEEVDDLPYLDSLLSFGAQWSRLEPYIDINTGEISAIDDLFCQYDTEKLLSCDPEEISDKILSYKLGSPYTKKQMNALITENVSKLLSLERQYGSIDSFYMKILVKDETQKTLVKELSSPKSPHKFIQFGEALITEYLKNVGYDIAKPDRHIRRILGRNILDCSEHENAPAYEAIDIVAAIARQLNRPAAEVDYILWAYCAKNYGEICTKNNPHCDRCVVKIKCKKAEV